MRKYVLLLGLFSFTYSIAQVTITASENVFIEGDIVDYAIADLSNTIDVGSSGANQIWDFSSLVESVDSYHYEYINSTGLPYENIMPDADLAIDISNDGNSYVYYDTQEGTAFKISGFYFSNSDGSYESYSVLQDVNGNPHSLDYVTYPISYLNSNSQNYSMEQIIVGSTSTYIYENANWFFDVDAWGMLHLPNHTYNNALRVHIVSEYDFVTYDNGVQTNTNHMLSNFYLWYVPEIKGYVFNYGEHVIDSNLTSYDAQWVKNISSAIHEITDKDVKVFPNPTNGLFTIESKNIFGLTIYDNLGRIVYSKKRSGSQIDLSKNKPGIYLLKITQNDCVYWKRIVLD